MINLSPQPWVALDVGGANLKAAHQEGSVRSHPFPVWKQPDRLEPALSSLLATLPPFQSVALTMTAELCDCFRTKSDGVRQVIRAVIAASRSKSVHVWGVDAQFHDPEKIDRNPQIAAASNWLALASWAGRLVPRGPGLLIDIGSTTTDLIPLRDGRPVSEGWTDTDRLRTGELVYIGVRRTPICALATHLVHRGRSTGLCAEHFSTTEDVYLILESIPESPENLDTADGRPATFPFARERLARMIGADRDQFSQSDARELAQSADDALMARLHSAASAVIQRSEPPGTVVISGSGEWLACRLASRILRAEIPTVRLSEFWSPDASTSACARALVELAREQFGGKSDHFGIPETL